MIKLLFVACFCFVPFICIAGCSKPDKSAAAKTAVIDKDSIFVDRYLPEIRDAFCADSLTLQYLRQIFKGKSVKGRYDIELFMDSTDSGGTDNHTRVDIVLNSTNIITEINVIFPRYFFHHTILVKKERMISIFGKYVDSHFQKMEDGSMGYFEFGKDCRSPKKVTCWINSDGSISDISMGQK
jgi:hypothetical protein